MKIPPYLQKGDIIGITCPAGYMAAEKAVTCITTLQNWGYQVMIGKTLGSKSKTYFSGTDEERTNELQAMLDDKNIKAILCGRGGYGVGRIIDKLDFTAFKKNLKWIIGFSDITVLHSHINKNIKIATLHAPMAAAFNDNGFKNKYIKSLKDALEGKKADYNCKPNKLNKIGKAEGELVGGNVSLLAHLVGTSDAIITKNKILFIEDIGEQLYSLDRMLIQLKQSGMFANLSGLIVGGFSEIKDTERPYGKKIFEIISDLIKEYKYPVCYNFPVSHNTENYALKCGAAFKLTITNDVVKLQEI